MLGEVALAGESVHDLHVGRVAGDRAQQPVPPVVDGVVVAVREEHGDGERRIPEPDVAVVPVALAAEALRQRGGGRGDDAAGLQVGQRTKEQEGAHDLLAVRTVVLAALGPLRPPGARPLERGSDVERRRRLLGASGTRSG